MTPAGVLKIMRVCGDKKSYGTAADAQKIAAMMRWAGKTGGKHGRAYECPVCGRYHWGRR